MKNGNGNGHARIVESARRYDLGRDAYSYHQPGAEVALWDEASGPQTFRLRGEPYRISLLGPDLKGGTRHTVTLEAAAARRLLNVLTAWVPRLEAGALACERRRKAWEIAVARNNERRARQERARAQKARRVKKATARVA